MMLLEELDLEDFRNYLRMGHESFSKLLDSVHTAMREAVPPEERLVSTLRYLVTGIDYADLKYSTAIPPQLLSESFQKHVKLSTRYCGTTYRLVVDVPVFVFQIPATGKKNWLETAHQFETMWQFTNCVGCMDGRHVLLNKPPGSGSLFYNFKETFSVVLFAVVNANYEFMHLHSGVNGSVTDSGVLKHTNFYENFVSGKLNLPLPWLLPGTNILAPYVFLGDGNTPKTSKFAISEDVLKSFPQKNLTHEKRIFNYRLSRARRVVENVFGILSSRFRLFQKPILLDIDNVDKKKFQRLYYKYCSCVDNEDIDDGSFREGDWRRGNAWINLDRNNVTRQSQIGNNVRNIFTDYFNGAGSVPFQRTINVLGSMH
ncbi:hypothetical protein PR048_023149 [Dryococelus australis]|uniref:DDE Tnp4 domain-containing protein n=1 Tax=Dryococelus australis TaxID=614101 RepID=A0ABQ9GT96_9NEOP|nr:hypothetical protein PR048_023149 [Dryococelus australis]